MNTSGQRSGLLVLETSSRFRAGEPDATERHVDRVFDGDGNIRRRRGLHTPIFFDLSYNSLKGLDAAFGQDEDIEGDPCYVITGKTKATGVTMWISRKSKLIRQIRNDLITGQMKIPDLTDEQAKSVIESMGQTPTAEAIKRMKEQMNGMRAMMSPGTTWSSIQVQRKIVVNGALSKADFAPQAAPAGK